MKQFVQKTIFTLSILALPSGCSDRKVLEEIPAEMRGAWIGMYSDPEISFFIDRDRLNVVSREYPSFSCKAEKIVSFKSGWIFKEKKIAVVCDKQSTDDDQKVIKEVAQLVAPDDYRKTFYIRVPDEYGEISVSHTKFMGKGWSGSEGTYEWSLDDFYKR